MQAPRPAPYTREFRRRLRARDHRAWTTLIEDCTPRLRNVAAKLLRQSADRDDAVAEAYHRAFRAAARYDPARPPYPWLVRILVNACLDRLDADRRRTAATLWRFPLARRSYRDSAPREQRSGRKKLMWALGQLPERSRVAVTLVYLMGVEADQAAEVLGVKRKNLFQACRRGLAKLRELLEPARTELLDDWAGYEAEAVE